MSRAARSAAARAVMHTVALADMTPVPWKNGGGLTRDLLCWPGAGEWQLRVSVAEVNRGGPFSAYPGVTRAFAVLQGAGVVLHFADGPLTLTPDSPPLHFDGAPAPDCTLVDGPTLDLNLMSRTGRAELARARPGLLWASGAPMRGVFTLHGATLHGAGPAPLQLPAGTLAFAAAAPCGAWQLDETGDGPASNWWLSFNPHAL
ncbi:MAG: HutD family protein [Rubrivivax sp.]|nr:HutD family protein [Rubrivivax sp.]